MTNNDELAIKLRTLMSHGATEVLMNQIEAKALLAERDADKKRIAELEARTVSVKLPDCDYGAVQHMSGGSDDYCNGFVDGTQNAIKRVKADCAAAGIKLEVGE